MELKLGSTNTYNYYRGGLLFYNNPPLFQTLPQFLPVRSPSQPLSHQHLRSFTPDYQHNLEPGDFGYHFPYTIQKVTAHYNQRLFLSFALSLPSNPRSRDAPTISLATKTFQLLSSSIPILILPNLTTLWWDRLKIAFLCLTKARVITHMVFYSSRIATRNGTFEGHMLSIARMGRRPTEADPGLYLKLNAEVTTRCNLVCGLYQKPRPDQVSDLSFNLYKRVLTTQKTLMVKELRC